MPTVLLLDVSLSMSRVVPPVTTESSTDTYTRRQLAIKGIHTFLDYLSQNCKLEFVSLVIFSSLYEQVVPFTRDYADIRSALGKLEEYNKTCVENALMGVNSIITEEWGTSPHCQVLLITDGKSGNSSSHNMSHNQASLSDKHILPPQLPYQLHVVCIAADASLAVSEPQFQHLIAKGSPTGELYVPEGALCERSVQQMFSKLCDRYYSTFTGTLHCGNLRCPVYLFPTPGDYDKEHESERVKRSVSKDLEICGFVSIKDIANPPYISRHVVLPLPAASVKSEINYADSTASMKLDLDGGGSDEKEIDKNPAFTVLLHGSLKVEQMTAIVQIGVDWYGMMYSYADSKKKSNLMLSIFRPGVDSLPWLGDLSRLTVCSEFPTPQYVSENADESPFPVCPSTRRSYTQNCVVWIKNTGLQADIQKILRSARRLPEKQQHFYKELNRLRSAALSFGFYDLLTALGELLERECTLLPGNMNPDAALHMTHVASMLRRADFATDSSRIITPLKTSFVSE